MPKSLKYYTVVFIKLCEYSFSIMVWRLILSIDFLVHIYWLLEILEEVLWKLHAISYKLNLLCIHINFIVTIASLHVRMLDFNIVCLYFRLKI